jgi:hypothetical protein
LISAEVLNLGSHEGDALLVKAIDKDGNTTSSLLHAGEKVAVPVLAGKGVILECVDISEPDDNAVILGDDIAVADGAV